MVLRFLLLASSFLLFHLPQVLEANEFRVYLGPLTELPGSSFSFEYQVRKHLKDKKVDLVTDGETNKILLEKPQLNYQLKVKLIREKFSADYFIFVKSVDIDKRQKLVFEVIDNSGEKIYSKEKIKNLQKAVEVSDLTYWIDDFFLSMPARGEVVSRRGKEVEIKFNKTLSAAETLNASFLVFQEASKAPSKGFIKSNSGGIYTGEITEEVEGEVSVGQKVSLVDNKAEKERVTESFTETNRSLIYNNPFKFSMRACTLLPLVGSLPKQSIEEDQAKLEKMIQSSSVCNYRSSEKMKSILNSFGNSDQYLYNKEVLKIFSEKLAAGSLLRLKFVKGMDGHSLIFDVVSENGENTYFSRSKFIKEYDFGEIKNQVQSWLLEYDKEIPYQGRVVEVLGDKVMVDFDRDSKYQDSQHFVIYRPTNLKIRSKVGLSYIEWAKSEIAQGTFTEVTEDYSVGVVRKISESKKKPQAGDWIITDDQLFLDGQSDYLYTRHNVKNQNRKIGRAKLGLELSQAEVDKDSIERSFVGGRIDLEYYLPYGFLFSLGAKRNLTGDDNFSASGSNLDLGLGFSFTPKKKWMIEALDFYVGYKTSDYTFEAKPSSVFDQLNFKSFYAGLGFDVFLSKRLMWINLLKIMPKVETKNNRKKIEVYKSVSGFSNSSYLFYQLKNKNGPILGINYSKYGGDTNSNVKFGLTDLSGQLGFLINF
jgi:hypothetical protein